MGLEKVFNTPFTMEKIGKILNKAKLGKAPGIDFMVYDVLKNGIAAKVLLSLFNLCFISMYIPSSWKKAIIRPIPKSASSDQRIPLNYRGISLLSVVGKLYSSLLNLHLSEYLETNKITANE